MIAARRPLREGEIVLVDYLGINPYHARVVCSEHHVSSMHRDVYRVERIRIREWAPWREVQESYHRDFLRPTDDVVAYSPVEKVAVWTR